MISELSCGDSNVTSGGTVSVVTVKFVFSVLLLFPLVSFAKNEILYAPITRGKVKLYWYVFSETSTSMNVLCDPLG